MVVNSFNASMPRNLAAYKDVCILLPGNQMFDKQISSHEKGGGIQGVEQWFWMATE